MSYTPSDISKLRTVSQQLCGTTLTTAKEMVAWFGAVQGQEYAQTKWGLGLRLPPISDTDIEKELSEGRLLRTHLLRPTWHLVTSDDIHWLLKLTAPRVNAANAYMYRKLELDVPIFSKCRKIIESLLQGNKQLTREEINAEFKNNNIEAEGFRLSYIMMRAELDGIICSGAKRGNSFTYALLEERAVNKNTFTKEEAIAELTLRYFQSRGPATVNDFSTWSGLTLTECRKGIEMHQSNLEKIAVDGNNYYFFSTLIPRNTTSAPLHLLPIYDEYIMGYKDRNAAFEFRTGLQPNPPLHFDCMILHEGQIIGTWKRTIGQKQIDVYYDLFRPLADTQKQLFDDALKRFGDFNKRLIVSHNSPTLPVSP